jgi:general secretion pathway protein K
MHRLLRHKVKRNRLNSSYDSSYTGQSGSALIITLLLITIIVGLAVDFIYGVYIDSSVLSNWSNAQRASLIAKSGHTLSAQYINEVNNLNYTDISELVLPVIRDFGPNASVVIKIEDENSRFNVNSIIQPNGLTNEKELSSLKKLFEYLNINPDLALAIADSIDPDSEPRLTYSEDISKNTFLWSLDEIKLMRDIDKETFDKVQPYLTVHNNKNSLVYQININTAPMPVLMSLHPEMTELTARNIIDYREDFPLESTAHVVRVTGMETIGQEILGRISVKSVNFRITANAQVNEISRIIESVMDTSMNIHFWRET